MADTNFLTIKEHQERCGGLIRTALFKLDQNFDKGIDWRVVVMRTSNMIRAQDPDNIEQNDLRQEHSGGIFGIGMTTLHWLNQPDGTFVQIPASVYHTKLRLSLDKILKSSTETGKAIAAYAPEILKVIKKFPRHMSNHGYFSLHHATTSKQQAELYRLIGELLMVDTSDLVKSLLNDSNKHMQRHEQDLKKEAKREEDGIAPYNPNIYTKYRK